MRYFKPEEFNHLKKMDQTFLRFLDDVRSLSGVPFYLTSDYRSLETNREIGGHPSSLHLRGMAVDFVTPGCRNRDAQRYYEELWMIQWAVNKVIDAGDSCRRNVQLEIVKGPNDWHLHLGLYPRGDIRKSKVVVALD
jgi:hypothetical protein